MVSCGWLPPPANGRKEGLKYLEGAVVRFSCNNGYSLAGPESSTCQADGTWSTPTPECQPGEPAPPILPLPTCAFLAFVTTFMSLRAELHGAPEHHLRRPGHCGADLNHLYVASPPQEEQHVRPYLCEDITQDPPLPRHCLAFLGPRSSWRDSRAT